MMTLKCNENQKVFMYSVLMLLQRKSSKPEACVSFLNSEFSKCWEDAKHGAAHNRDSLLHKSQSVSEREYISTGLFRAAEASSVQDLKSLSHCSGLTF